MADFVAKVGGWLLRRNNRIAGSKFLNQHCASTVDLESMLLLRGPKSFCNNIDPSRPPGPSPGGSGYRGEPAAVQFALLAGAAFTRLSRIGPVSPDGEMEKAHWHSNCALSATPADLSSCGPHLRWRGVRSLGARDDGCLRQAFCAEHRFPRR